MREQEKGGAVNIDVRNLTMAYGSFVVMRNLSFSIQPGEVFVIMGGSGCGKSTLMRHMIGLMAPAGGEVLYDGVNFWECDPEERTRMMRRFGVLYQAGALWSSMTLAENVALPLEEYTDLAADQISELVSLKLALVGLAGFENYFPAEISGGMKKRAGLARAMALDPVSARRLDDLILEVRDRLGTTVVVVTHELASIFAIADNSVFLDTETKTQIAIGNPRTLRDECGDPKVRAFLTRGAEDATAEGWKGTEPS